MIKLDVFLKGEGANLCIPTEEFALNSDWYSWFNDSHINMFLDWGDVPNTREAQLSFFRNEHGRRLILIIESQDRYVGVCSLSSINHQKRSAQFSIVVNHKHLDVKSAPFVALEAAALITEHGMTAMGLDRIWASQHARLASWGQRLELLGYRVEGIAHGGFRKGRDQSDLLLIACTYEHYQRVIERRKRLWDTKEKMTKRLAALPQNRFSGRLRGFFDEEGSLYYSEIENL